MAKKDKVKINEALKIATQNPSKLTKAQQQLLIKNGLDDFVRGGKTQSPMGDLAMLGLTGAAVKNPLKALEVIGTDPNDHRELSLEAAMQKGAMSALNPISKIKRLGRGVSRTWDAVNTAMSPRQLATVTPGANPLKIPPKFQPPPGQPLAIKGLSGSSLIKPKKNVKGFTGNVYEVSKKEIPQIKQQLGEWLNQQLKEKGNVKNINRQDFGTIIIDGEPREISRITNYLTGDGKLPLLPKVVTRKQAAFKRIQATQPPKNELTNLGRQLGLTTEQINEYYQEAVAGFKGVRDAAARNSKFKGEYHAGHFYPASRGGPTSRRSAGIELGKQNVTKGSKLEGSINIYAAQKAGIPTTWAEDMKMWLRDKKGSPGPRYESDFSNAQRNVIESIPWDATQEQVEAIWKQHKLDKVPNIEQYKAVERELAPRALQIGGDRR